MNVITVGRVKVATIYAVEVAKGGKVLGYFREGYPQTGNVSATRNADYAALYREREAAEAEAQDLGAFFPAEEKGYTFRAVGIEVPPLEVPAVVAIETLEAAFGALGLERAV